MAKKKEKTVTIRIKIAGYELEVQGEQKWAEKTVNEFVQRIKKCQNSEIKDAKDGKE